MIKKIICMLMCICILICFCSCEDTSENNYIVKVYSGEKLIETYNADDYMTIDNGLKIYCGDRTYKILGGTVIIE